MTFKGFRSPQVSDVAVQTSERDLAVVSA
jgi:hypothetical protein